MTPRADAVWILLRAYLAWVPGPQTATGNLVRRSAPPGEVGAKTIRCEACIGTGRRRQRGIGQRCDDCDGRGTVRVDPQTQKRPAVDAERQPGPFTGAERTAWERQTELTLRRLDSTLKVRTGEEAEHDTYTGAVDARDKLYARGSFAELDTALSWLRDVKPEAHSLVWAALIYAPTTSMKKGMAVPEPTGQVLRTLEAICEVLATRMPDVIIVPPWLRTASPPDPDGKGRWANGFSQQRRDDEICAAREKGTPVASIAAAFGLKPSRVYELIATATSAPAVASVG